MIAGIRDPLTKKAGRLSQVFIVLMLWMAAKTWAQAPAIYTPNIIPPSPNAASLMKFSDIPVSTYTGTADVTVPIYNIEAKGISIPVSVAYHTGGIRLREEAGWVGLGWALNAGGSISRTIMDKDDFGSGTYFNVSLVPEIATDMATYPSTYNSLTGTKYAYAFFCNYLVYTAKDTLDYYHVFSSNTSSPYDMEPDIYSYNFPGHSGKFIITREGKVVMQKQENLKFQFESNGNSFTITDEQGNVYYFADKEYSKPNAGGASSISTWQLSKVTTQQKDTVTFNYTSDNTYTQVLAPLNETLRTGCAGYEGTTATYGAGTLYLNLTLSSIDFTSGQLQFSFDNSRTDLQNGKKLNTIKVYSKSPAGLTYVKEHQFFYSYFNPGASNAYEQERLRLDSIREASNSNTLPPYSFTYNAGTTAFKDSYAVDHWGFYNGQSGNSSFIPGFNGLVAPLGNSYYLSLSGANREPDASNMQAFSLRKVNYPTGGYTQFDYEPNYYDRQKSINGPQDYPQYTLIDTAVTIQVSAHGTTNGSIDFTKLFPPVVYGNAHMSVTFKTQANDANSTTYRSQNGKIYFTFQSNTWDMSGSYLNCTNVPSICTESGISLTLGDNVYNWTAYIDPTTPSDFQYIQVLITWQELRTVHYNNQTLMGGGLRIKSVTDYSANNVVAKKRTYNYLTGRLMSYVSYARNEPMRITQSGAQVSCESLTQYGSSYNQLTSGATGNIVGYDTVEEYTVDPTTNADLGKTVYQYYNLSDTVMYCDQFKLPGLLNMYDNLNGSLLKKIVYADNSGVYSKVSEADNFYHTTNRTPYFNVKYQDIDGSSDHSNGTVGPCPADTAVQTLYLACFYPSIKSERVLLDSTKETTFDQVTGQAMTVTKSFKYDNPLHYNVTRSTVLDSKGNKHVSFMKYVQDYIPTGYNVTLNTILDTLLGKNMVSIPIEKRDSLYYAGSSTGYVAGAQLTSFKIVSPNNVIMPDKTYKLAIANPVTDFQPMAISFNTVTQDSRYLQMVSMDSYDGAYNINQYTAIDRVKNSFIWDYNNTYPIAQVKGSAVSNAAYTSFEADGKGGWAFTGTPVTDNTAPTGGKAYNLNNDSLKKTGLTNGTVYVVSYWSKNGTYTISGGSNTYITGKTINGWTYYEYKVTASGTSIKISAASGTHYIDEVRLYPATAQMTTYTYTPLVGMTSQCDVNNRITYYEYDGFSRLVVVRDQDKNVVKKICYNYYGQTACDNTIYFNVAKSGTYTRNNCGTGYTGSQVTYTVAAGTYSATSQAAADALAQNDVNTNGQSYANAHGTCTAVTNPTITCTNYTTNSGFTVTYTNVSTSAQTSFSIPTGNHTLGTLPPGTYNVTISNPSNSLLLYFAVCSTGGTTGTTSVTFNNIVVSSTSCNNVDIDSPF
ncbi:MAG TPA: DUF5977 domain-containing protein [Chitinophagaceae bacterium]|nr:DUF5977 domain-containing protein [Chitinophagaceae bacterium]